MDKDLLYRRNVIDVNKIASKCLRITILFLISLWLFTSTKYYNYDMISCMIIFVASIVLLFIPTVIVDILHMEYLWIKNIVILCCISVVFLMSTFLSYNYIVLLIFSILIATVYCDKKLIVIASGIDCICIFIILLLRFILFNGMVSQDFNNITEAIIYGGFIKVVMILLTTLFAYYIVERNMFMLDKTIEANHDLNNSQKELIYAFSELSESKSKVTGEHIRRVAEYMKILGTASGFTAEYVDKLSVAAMMHDIGKLMIPEEILDKPDRLTEEEYSIMKSHVLYGEALLSKCPGEILQIARTIALQHHERWDGSGYLGMKGEEIAYISRLMAVCDVFDALTSERYYKGGWSLDDTYNEIVKNSGTQFDPDVVELFKDHFVEFEMILKSMPDHQIY